MAQGIVVVGSGVDPALYYNKTQVDTALAKKLDASGGTAKSFISFDSATIGLSWTISNGDRLDLRPYYDGNLFQLVRIPADGSIPGGYGVLNVNADDNIYTVTREGNVFYFSSVGTMQLSASFGATSNDGSCVLHYSIPTGYSIASIVFSTTGWVGACYATEITSTSCKVFFPVQGTGSGPFRVTAYITIVKMLG